tara:strand:- start:13 stop:426 length:414 start_codon:yes stop_codon:yes gene_type:complete
MAKFENHLKNSDLTWSDLSDEISAKIDSYENVYESYSNAHAADDTKLINKYDAQLDKLDSEILSMIKKQESASKSVEKKETSPLAEAKPTEQPKEQPKVEVKLEPKEEVKAESKESLKEEPKSNENQSDTWVSFWWD